MTPEPVQQQPLSLAKAMGSCPVFPGDCHRLGSNAGAETNAAQPGTGSIKQPVQPKSSALYFKAAASVEGQQLANNAYLLVGLPVVELGYTVDHDVWATHPATVRLQASYIY